MYVPAHFSMSDADALRLLAEADTGDLVVVEDGVPAATFLPFLFDPCAGELGTLYTHVARTNTAWRARGEALVIVHGPDHYVSPGVLPSKAGSGKAVPTWDYVTVHAYGPVIAREDPAWLRDMVDRLTARHEAGRAHPWDSSQVPGDYIPRMLRAAVGIELPVARLVAKAKFSQNKTPADVAALLAEREAAGDHAGAAMYREVSLPAAQARADTLASVARRRRQP